MPGEAGLRDLAYSFEHFMDVDGFALDRSIVGERLHPIDEGDDSVCLVTDQLRQLATGRVGVLLEQLGRAAYPGKRVLDLVREHRRHCRNRPGGISVD